MSERDWLLVSESFYTHQGEGPTAGRLAFFVRLGGCNLHCRWCDTPYTWVFDDRHAAMHGGGSKYDPQTELKRVPIYTVSDQCVNSPASRFVITGGEPMLQQDAVLRLFKSVAARKSMSKFEIETAGTIAPSHELAEFPGLQWNVSLKLEHSWNPLELRRVPEAITALIRCNSVFKFVVRGQDPDPDIEEICQLIDEFEIPGDRIWLMPLGTEKDVITRGLKVLSEYALRYGWNITSRMQDYIYDGERGH